MRFLLGVFMGAVVTLGVATVFDGPTGALVARGTSLIEGGSSAWNRFFLATGKAVFPVAEEADTPAVEVPFQAEAQTDLPTQPAEEERTADPSSPTDEAPTSPANAAVAPSPAMEPLPELPSPERVATHQELEPSQEGTEAVWVPFRSQMSAEGFAARLSEQTQHPFQVTRQGPGRYQVNFAYANQAQRERLADMIRAATGEATP